MTVIWTSINTSFSTFCLSRVLLPQFVLLNGPREVGAIQTVPAACTPNCSPQFCSTVPRILTCSAASFKSTRVRFFAWQRQASESNRRNIEAIIASTLHWSYLANQSPESHPEVQVVGGAYSSAPKCEEDEDAGVFSASLRVCTFSLSWGTCDSGTAARCREHGG